MKSEDSPTKPGSSFSERIGKAPVQTVRLTPAKKLIARANNYLSIIENPLYTQPFYPF
jgi:hypothetical protein